MYIPCISAAAGALGANITERKLLDYPAAGNPIDVWTASSEWTWGDWTEILSGVDHEFALVGLVIAGAEEYSWRYCFDIGYGEPGAEQPCISFSGGANHSFGLGGGPWETLKIIKPFRKFPAGTRIVARVKGSRDQAMSVYVKPVYVKTPITEAAIPLPGWAYRRTVTIDNTSNPSTLTDLPVKVVLNTGNFDYSHCKVDGGDIRFYDGDTELDYFISTWDVTGESIIYVKVPSIPGGGTKQIEMKYGNPEAGAVQDPDKVLIFYDNFEQDTPGEPPSQWTIFGTNGSFEVSTSEHYDGNKSLHFYTPKNPSDPKGIRKDLDLPDCFAVEYYRWDSIDGIRTWSFCLYSDGTVAVRIYTQYHEIGQNEINYYDGGTSKENGYYDTKKWAHIKYIVNVSDHKYSLWLNGVKEVTDAAFYNNVTPNRIQFSGMSGSSSGHVYLDRIMVYKAADPEPTVTLGDEEEL